MRGVFWLGVKKALWSLLNVWKWGDGASCVSSDMVRYQELGYQELDMFIQV